MFRKLSRKKDATPPPASSSNSSSTNSPAKPHHTTKATGTQAAATGSPATLDQIKEKIRPKELHRASTTAPVNIAVIKYWGKRDSDLNLPTNSSLSVTLSQRDLHAHTTASCSPSFPAPDTLTLNNTPSPLTTPRTQSCLSQLRTHRRALESSDPTLPPLSTYPLRLASTNNFPTAAGLASSAAGFAALVRAIADLYQLPQPPEDLSVIARTGSGSACRSLLGGYVAWHAGRLASGADSRAAQVAPAAHWPSLRALIVVASAAGKDVPSTAGMQATVATSALFPARAADVVPHRMSQMRAAVEERDFSTFGLLAMRDSNSFHACCLDTWPPVFYMNEVSRGVVRAVEAVNAAAGEIVCAYTFDAGPNAVVFFEEGNEDVVLGGLAPVVGHAAGFPRAAGHAKKSEQKPMGLGDVKIDEKVAETLRAGVQRVIYTGVGEGPVKVHDHLIDEYGDIVRK